MAVVASQAVELAEGTPVEVAVSVVVAVPAVAAVVVGLIELLVVVQPFVERFAALLVEVMVG